MSGCCGTNPYILKTMKHISLEEMLPHFTKDMHDLLLEHTKKDRLVKRKDQYYCTVLFCYKYQLFDTDSFETIRLFRDLTNSVYLKVEKFDEQLLMEEAKYDFSLSNLIHDIKAILMDCREIFQEKSKEENAHEEELQKSIEELKKSNHDTGPWLFGYDRKLNSYFVSFSYKSAHCLFSIY